MNNNIKENPAEEIQDKNHEAVENECQDVITEDSKDEQINMLKKELSEFDDKYRRVYADFENSKKRLQKDKELSLEYANETILKDLLPVLDSLEAGIKLSSDNRYVCDGLENTMKEFMKVLGKYGMSKISTDCEFDPNIHQCAMRVKDSTKNDDEISQVLQTGYMYRDRVLRASMVSVTKN